MFEKILLNPSVVCMAPNNNTNTNNNNNNNNSSSSSSSSSRIKFFTATNISSLKPTYNTCKSII